MPSIHGEPRPSAVPTPESGFEKYLTDEWRARVPAVLQGEMLKIILPSETVDNVQRDREIEWMVAMAPHIYAWLEQRNKENFFRVAKRLDQGPKYSPAELRAILAEIGH